MTEKRLHAFVSGMVQGVFFRSHTRQLAQRLGLCGFVRNLPDGRVEVVAEGPEEKVRELERWLHKGPASASVQKCESKWSESKKEFSAFGVSYGGD